MNNENQLVDNNKRNSNIGIVSWIIVALVVVGLAIGLFLQWNEAKRLRNELDNSSNQLNSVQSDLSKAKTELKDIDSLTTATIPATQPNTPTISDEDAIKKAMATYLRAPEGSTATINDVRGITAKTDKFASVVSGQISGNILKKVDDTWIVIRYGQDPLTQETIDRFGIPQSIAYPNR